jgi:hypothetical protein
LGPNQALFPIIGLISEETTGYLPPACQIILLNHQIPTNPAGRQKKGGVVISIRVEMDPPVLIIALLRKKHIQL